LTFIILILFRLLPGESGPILKEACLPDLPYELRMKIMSTITAEVPGWKTSKLERSNSRSGIMSDAERERSRTQSSEQVKVDNISDNKNNGNDNGTTVNNTTTTRKNVTSKKTLSTEALAAATGETKMKVVFGPGPVGLALQSTKWIPIGDIFDTVGSAMVREFTKKDTQTSITESIMVGSILISINNVPTAGATFTETMNQLRFCPRPMTLEFFVPPSKKNETDQTEDDRNETPVQPRNRSSINDRDLNYSGSVSYRWIDKVRAAFLDMMFVIFSGGITTKKSFADRMFSTFGRSKISSSKNSSSSPRSGRKRPVKCCADYRRFLPRPSSDHAKNQIAMKLMKKKFTQAHPDNMKPFMAVFVETQAFNNFIEDAAHLHYQGQGFSGRDELYSREAGIEILNQCIQTADINEGMLLDAI